MASYKISILLKKPVFSLLLFLVLINATAQTRQRYRIDQVFNLAIDEANKNPNTGQFKYRFALKNAIVYDNISTYTDTLRAIEMEATATDKIKDTSINFTLEFEDVIFEEMGTFKSFNFHGQLIFTKCILSNGLKFNNCNLMAGIMFERCVIGNLLFGQCNFSVNSQYLPTYSEYGPSNMGQIQSGTRTFTDCNFSGGGFAIQDISGENAFSFVACTVNSNYLFKIRNQKCSKIDFSDCNFNARVALEYLDINGPLTIANTRFGKTISIKQVSYNQNSSRVEYDSLHKKLTSNNTDSTPYFPVGEKGLNDINNYKSLMSTMYNLQHYYKINGDGISANKVYVDIHDYETNMLGHIYQKSQTTEAYFNWKLNRFLKIFCDYGTNPIRSLRFAIITMIFFAFLYFIFPSEKDNLNGAKINNAFQKLFSKVTKENRHEGKFGNETEQLKKVLQFTMENKQNLPEPLYSFSLLNVKVQLAWFKVLERRAGFQDSLFNANQGFLFSAYSVIYLFGFLLAGFLMRLINAIALSINAFVTLGYGELSAKGMARYLVVIEGAIGWFLLSIFSVSLINQILG